MKSSLVPGSLITNAVLMLEQMYATIENHQSLDSARKGPAMQPLCVHRNMTLLESSRSPKIPHFHVT